MFRCVPRGLFPAILMAVLAVPAAAQQQVDLELVLLADATGSIDAAEVAFQRQGYADAITHPSVLAAIAGGFNQRIAVTFIEWGDRNSQKTVVPWTVIDGTDSAAGFAQVLTSIPRLAFGRNAIGSALLAGMAAIEGNGIEGRRKVIDFSGDSANSWNGADVHTARELVLSQGIVINALALYCRTCNGRPSRENLEAAYQRRIIGGPRSFVVTADSRESFAEAVRRKLILEIADLSLDRAPGNVARY